MTAWATSTADAYLLQQVNFLCLALDLARSLAVAQLVVLRKVMADKPEEITKDGALVVQCDIGYARDQCPR